MSFLPRKDFNVFDDFFKDSFFDYRENSIMKTDIKENDDNYELIMDLPGIPKENIKMHINDGYLVINAYTTKTDEEKNKLGKFVKKERYYGECSRSFFIGDGVIESDIKASFKNGTLNIMIPKIDNNTKEEIKYIEID